jgi:L-iditol 2-dehydrogenase
MYCRGGAPNLCPRRRSIGSRENGGFARFLRVPARNLHRLPPQLSLQAATFTEPLACVVHALLEQTSLALGEYCIVSGPGPIGLLCAQVARASGCKVTVLGTAADVKRLAVAGALGFATHSVDEPSLEETLLQQTAGRGADAVIECAGAEASAALALKLVRPRGKYIQVGLFGRSIAWNADLACLKELHITGSNATVPSAWPKAIALLASGAVQTEPLVSEVVPLSEWERAFARLRQKDALKILLQPE